MTDLRYGDFVRVRADQDFRAGHDGFVVAPPGDDGVVGLTFYYDRYGEAVRSNGILGSSIAACVGTEAWELDELDLSSIDR